MKLALSGSSSTGKSTLLDLLVAHNYFIQQGITKLSVDIRKILKSLTISPNELEKDSKKSRSFQWEVLKTKALIESKPINFITDRSYIDLASYWIARTEKQDQETKEYVAECKRLSLMYDLHIFLPYGRIPFICDGFRPEGQKFQKTVADNICNLLPPINVLTVDMSDNEQAKTTILANLHQINSRR